MYWLDLNVSSTVDSTIPSNSLHSAAAEGSQWHAQGAFFTDANLTTMYSFGGFQEDKTTTAVPLDTVEAFNTTLGTWANVTVNGGAFNSLSRTLASSANAASAGLGLSFVTGGSESGEAPPGLIRFDASDPTALAWTNETQGVPRMIGSTMQYARFGNKGVLIAIGGYTDLNSADLHDMSEIMVYDVDSKTWFNVTAYGDIPDSRSEFCSTISPSPDDSSFQITIYGGWNIHQTLAYEDIYVLAIPSFRWINMTQTQTFNAEASSLPAGAGRYTHTCDIYNNRQMVVLGGSVRFPGSSFVQNDQRCNTSYPAIRVLDVSTFAWQTRLSTATDPYVVPDQVWKSIGGR